MLLFEQAFWLIALHFVADFHLQSDFVVRAKAPGGSPVWPWVMSAHSALHGVMVAIILGPVFGAAEFVAHWVVDHAKTRGWVGEGRRGFMIDQAIHIGLKFVWIGLAAPQSQLLF